MGFRGAANLMHAHRHEPVLAIKGLSPQVMFRHPQPDDIILSQA